MSVPFSEQPIAPYPWNVPEVCMASVLVPRGGTTASGKIGATPGVGVCVVPASLSLYVYQCPCRPFPRQIMPVLASMSSIVLPHVPAVPPPVPPLPVVPPAPVVPAAPVLPAAPVVPPRPPSPALPVVPAMLPAAPELPALPPAPVVPPGPPPPAPVVPALPPPPAPVVPPLALPPVPPVPLVPPAPPSGGASAQRAPDAPVTQICGSHGTAVPTKPPPIESQVATAFSMHVVWFATQTDFTHSFAWQYWPAGQSAPVTQRTHDPVDRSQSRPSGVQVRSEAHLVRQVLATHVCLGSAQSASARQATQRPAVVSQT